MAQIEIGTTFIRHSSKHKRLETVIDIYTTTNNKGETIKVSYVCSHELLGQIVTDYDVPKTTILRSLDSLKQSLK